MELHHSPSIYSLSSSAYLGVRPKYRANQIGTANAVDLPPKDKSVTKDENVGTITGALATHSITSLSAGSVPERNEILSDGVPAHPEYVTSDPYGLGSTGGCLVSLHITGTDPRPSLMSAADYDAKYPA